ncbi:hypothetical protein GHK86_11685 [Acidimicrobiaceae bacterium USS-CC1]|uniref:Uncharacterized protein n=1 Tax=Acidiferrimicrobium australe TaxID=2664430 RepID=A0ABW9QUQ1_9ACTN|nr:hypothetical protein [Acidiferrimicrobium australe]
MTQDDSAVVDDRRYHRFVYRQDGVEARLDHPDRSARVGIDWAQPPDATGAGRGPGAASPAPGPGEVAGG